MSNKVTTGNRLIAKNALLLYVRMAVVMILNLYISRIVLKALGVEDFGIYNVVGGVVALCSYLNSALTAATQRYLNFAMGKESQMELNKVFCMSVNIHFVLVIFVFLFAETAGLWFLNERIVIPASRMSIANWVYQFSIASTIIQIVAIPYSALIIAHERMSVYAYISIAEVFLKLGTVLFIPYLPCDNLLEYALFIMLALVFTRLAMVVYSARRFAESKYKFMWDSFLFKDMFGFTGWNFMGATAGIAMNQGVNILLNLYFGPIVNASRSIAAQVQQAFTQLATNFTTAINPQIVKSYSSGDMERMTALVLASSKYTFLIMAVTAMPFLVKMDYVLRLWLMTVPDGAVMFTRLLLVYQLTVNLTYSLNMTSQASGNVRLFQIVESVTLILILPIGWLQFKWGMGPASIFVSMVLLSLIALFLRLTVLRRIIGFQVGKFVHQVLFPVGWISCAYVFLYEVSVFVFVDNDSLGMTVLQMAVVFVLSAVLAYILGLNRNEKTTLWNIVRKVLIR